MLSTAGFTTSAAGVDTGAAAGEVATDDGGVTGAAGATGAVAVGGVPADEP
nr:MAG TPA_asm: hypothetical protein [Caudoviricetes sp.]